MADALPALDPATAGARPIDEARRLFRASEKAEANPDRAIYIEQLREYLTFVDRRKGDLTQFAGELSHQLDSASMALYRLSQPDLASKAAEVGLLLSPGEASLLHHKALILLAGNRDIGQILPLLEEAAHHDPNDKGIWATTGDALKIAGRPAEAAEAYLKAQQLDATSTQYVEKALRLVPNHPGALRLCLQLARAHGGNQQALDACEALLSVSPNDPELLFSRVELRASLGQVDAALDAVPSARAARPGDPRLALIAGRLQVALQHPADALAEFQLAAEASDRLTVPELSELAERAESAGDAPDLVIQVRRTILEREPRNLANLRALRLIAQRLRRFDLGIATCTKILEVSPDNLEAMRALAEFQLTAGKTDEGFETYRAIGRAHPHEAAELRKAVDAARAAGRIDLLLEFARTVVEEDPADLATRELVAQALEATGDKSGALEVYETLSEGKPSEAHYLLERKRLLEELGRPEGLPAVYDGLFKASPARSDLAFDRGILSLTRARDAAPGSPEREAASRAAIGSFERAVLDQALGPKSLLGLASAAQLLGDHPRAVRAFEEYLSTPGHADDALVLKGLGHAYRMGGHPVEADQAYSRALALGHEETDLLWGEVEALTTLNQDAKALRYLDVLAKREPGNAEFLRRKGQLLLKSGRRAEGTHALKAAAERARDDPEVEFEVAHALRAGGAYPDAIAAYREGLKGSPESRAGRLALAETLNLSGQYNEVVPIVDTLLTEDSNDLAAWRVRADACRALGRPADLEYSLKAILLLDPADAHALIEKYRLHVDQGERSDAFETLAAFLASEGPAAKDAALVLEAADLAAELGKTEEANRLYERSAQLDPAHASQVGRRRARLHLSAGRPDLALEVLDAASKTSPGGEEAGSPVELLRAEILGALERPGEAEGVYRAVLAKDSRALKAELGLARSLLDQGKHADAKAFLTGAIPTGPPSAGLFLLLAEAESGLGANAEAAAAVEKGLEALPDSIDLIGRLGELKVAQEDWAGAAAAFRRAIELDSGNADLLLRAGFVAERQGHPTEAVALYERATEIGPSNKFAWSGLGLALLGGGRPEEAASSFDKALELDGEFDAARQGKKAALEKTRATEVERIGREALLLEARLHRAVTKNDLFVTLHVPFDILEPILSGLSRVPKVELASLSEEEFRVLESESCQLVSAALDRRAEGLERRGFSLPDVAVLSPPTRTLSEIQRLFGYLQAVLEVEIRAENLRLTPGDEELARRALLMPPEQRTLFQLVRTLGVGIFRARLIKAVESTGTAVHAPLPSLDFGQYSPEFQPGAATPTLGRRGPESPASPEPPEAPSETRAPTPAPTTPAEPAPAPRPVPSRARCVGCGGLASIVHDCGAPVCAHCIVEFRTCPKCRKPATLPIPEPPPPAPVPAVGAPTAAHQGAIRGALQALHQALPTSKSAKAASPPHAARPIAEVRERLSPPPSSSKPAPAHSADGGAPSRPPHPTRPKEKADDEPRL